MALSDFWPKLQDEILDRKPGVNAEGVPQEQGMGHVRKFPAPLDLVLVPDPPSFGTRSSSLGTRPSQFRYSPYKSDRSTLFVECTGYIIEVLVHLVYSTFPSSMEIPEALKHWRW